MIALPVDARRVKSCDLVLFTEEDTLIKLLVAEAGVSKACRLWAGSARGGYYSGTV
jgi:hypothetical protein